MLHEAMTCIVWVHTAGQYISFDSSHIWETGIQTYIAGLQHLPISHADTSNTIPSDRRSPLPQLATIEVDSYNEQHADKVELEEQSHDAAPPVDGHSPSAIDSSSHSSVTIPAGSTTPQNSDAVQDVAWHQQPIIGKKLYLSLAPHNGSAMDSFLKGVSDPSEWGVYVWQAPESGANYMGADHCRKVIKQWEEEVSQVVTFPQAAGKASSS